MGFLEITLLLKNDDVQVVKMWNSCADQGHSYMEQTIVGSQIDLPLGETFTVNPWFTNTSIYVHSGLQTKFLNAPLPK